MNQFFDQEVTIINILDSCYIDEMRIWRNQDFVRKNMTNQELITEVEHMQYIKNLKKSKNTEVFVMLVNNEPVSIMTFKYYWDERLIEPGIYVINEAYLGKGLGKLMGFLRMNYIFDIMPDGQMQNEVLETNTRNNELQKKLGCVFYKKTELIDNNGEKKVAIVYRTTKSDWENKQEIVLAELKKKFNMEKVSSIPRTRLTNR